MSCSSLVVAVTLWRVEFPEDIELVEGRNQHEEEIPGDRQRTCGISSISNGQLTRLVQYKYIRRGCPFAVIRIGFGQNLEIYVLARIQENGSKRKKPSPE